MCGIKKHALLHPWDTWLGIPIFGSDFRDPHQKRNSDSVFVSGDSSRIFSLNAAVEKLSNQNYDSKIRNYKKNNVGTQYTSFSTRERATAIPTTTQRRLLLYLHPLNTCPAIPTSTQCLSLCIYIYSIPILLYLYLLNACPIIPTSTQHLSRSTQKKAGMFWLSFIQCGAVWPALCRILRSTHLIWIPTLINGRWRKYPKNL